MRVDEAVRDIDTTPATLWRAFTDEDALVAWLPPDGMVARVLAFDPREGGPFDVRLTHTGEGTGKTTADSDVVRGVFGPMRELELVTWLVSFDSDDPQFAGTMRMEWTFEPLASGTRVRVAATDVPDGISPEEHQVGLEATLANMARTLEENGPSASPHLQ